MNINIEKITNGYVLTVDGVKTFCDVPEAICGTMAELILKHCKELDAAPAPGKKGLSGDLARALAQVAVAQPHVRLENFSDDGFADGWKYSQAALVHESDPKLLEKLKKMVLK